MNDEVDRFTAAGEKIISHELNQVIWCNHMDMLALVTKDNILEMYRISYKNQKIFQSEESNQITHCAFSPDAKLFVYFLDNGAYKIVKTENGEMLFHIKPKPQANQSVHSSAWVNYSQAKNMEKINPFKKYQMLDNLIPQLGPHICSDKNNLQRLAYFNDPINYFTLMVTNDNQGNVQINLNGIFCLARFRLSDYIPAEIRNDTAEYMILRSFVRPDIEVVSFLVSTKPTQNKNKFKVFLIDVEISSFHLMKETISKVGYLLSFVEEHMQYLTNTFDAMLDQLKSIQRAFSSKIFILEDCIKNHSLSSTPIQEFLIYLTTGTYSSALHHYFGKELFDCKILQKMDETIYNTFTNIQEFVLESVLNTLERLTVLLTSLQNSTTQGYYQAFFGIDPEVLQRIIYFVSELYVRADKFLKEITETKIDIRNLIVWMNKCVIKTSGDAEIENTKSHLNKLSFDIRRLIKIFEDENIFYMKHLFAYFQNDNANKDQPPTSFDQSLKNILTEINKLSIDNQKKDDLQDVLEEHCLFSLEQQFSELQHTIFDGTQIPQVDLKTPKKLETGLSNVFRRSEEQNFKYLTDNIKEHWKFIVAKPCETLSKSFRLQSMVCLGEFDNINNSLALSDQENTEESLAMAFPITIGRSECLAVVKKSQVTSETPALQLSILQLPNYDFKEMVIWQNNSILVLLASKTSMTNEKPHCIIALVDTSGLEGMSFVQQNIYLDVMDILKANSDQLRTNPLEFKKSYKIDSLNVCKLKASLKGLISVLVDDSKLMFFVD